MTSSFSVMRLNHMDYACSRTIDIGGPNYTIPSLYKPENAIYSLQVMFIILEYLQLNCADYKYTVEEIPFA